MLIYLDTPDFLRHKDILKLFRGFDLAATFPNFIN